MSTTNLESKLDFFSKLLDRIAMAFKAKDACIVECKDKDGKHYKVLALIQLNKMNEKIQFLPIARLYNSNPMEEIKMISEGAVLASQIPMSKWIKELQKIDFNTDFDISKLN